MMETTPDQRLAVRRDECRMHGHTFTQILKGESLSPHRVVCSDCGASWRIHPDDAGENFGQGGALGVVEMRRDGQQFTAKLLPANGENILVTFGGEVYEYPGVAISVDDEIAFDDERLVVTRADGTVDRFESL